MAAGDGSRYSDYDPLAWIYNRHMSGYWAAALPVLENLLLRYLAPGSHILDLCCGTGQLAQALVRRGYRVTGIDGSEEMLRFARDNAPSAEFILADARAFRLSSSANAVVSTYDSLNHIMSLEELASAFRSVCLALAPGGPFLFDLNMLEKYSGRWTDSFGIVEDEYACVVRGSYQEEERMARFDATIFVLRDGWQRTDLTLWQKCYSVAEVQSALEAAGFTEICAYDWRRDLEPAGESGRTFFICRKPATGAPRPE